MADFCIVKPEPFVVEGIDGDTYELPRVKDLSADAISGLAGLADAKETGERIRTIKEFVLSLCPDLEREPLADLGYVQLFTELVKGSGIDVGEL